MSDLVQLGLLGAAFLIVFLLVGRAMKQRDARWESDDWRQKGRGTASFGNALLEIQSFFQPGAKHQVEEVRRVRLEEEESGDRPEAGDDESETWRAFLNDTEGNTLALMSEIAVEDWKL